MVGGLFEFEGKFLDLSIKGGGGVAVLLLISVFVRPFYNAEGIAPDAIDVTLPKGETINFLIDAANSDYSENSNSKTYITTTDNNVKKLRPIPADQDSTYTGHSWLEVFQKVAHRGLNCLDVTSTGNVVSLSLNLDQAVAISAGNDSMLTCK